MNALNRMTWFLFRPVDARDLFEFSHHCDNAKTVVFKSGIRLRYGTALYRTLYWCRFMTNPLFVCRDLNPII